MMVQISTKTPSKPVLTFCKFFEEYKHLSLNYNSKHNAMNSDLEKMNNLEKTKTNHETTNSEKMNDNHKTMKHKPTALKNIISHYHHKMNGRHEFYDLMPWTSTSFSSYGTLCKAAGPVLTHPFIGFPTSLFLWKHNLLRLDSRRIVYYTRR